MEVIKMSLGYIFVKLDDGKYYQGAVLGDTEGDWFICFDEDEPPELVIDRKSYDDGISPGRIIEYIGLQAEIISKSRHFMGRVFKEDMKPAVAFFLKITAPPSVEWLKHHDAVYNERPDSEGTFWTFED